MISSTTGLVLWPAGLPLPYVDAQGQPQHATLAGGLQHMRIQRRNRFRSLTVSLSVRWVLTIAEYDSFKSFHRDDTYNGIAQFSLQLRYPYNSSLTEWRVRFIGNYTATYQEGMWMVEAILELLTEIPQTEPTVQLPLNWGGYQVLDEAESDGYSQFVDADGHEYYVRTI